MRRITQAQQRKIHAMARELGMDDDLLHSYVSMMAQKDSLKALSLTEAIKVIDGMEAKKGYAAGDRISRRQEQYLFILRKKLGWTDAQGNPDKKRLDGFVKKQYGIDDYRWITRSAASKVIEALKVLTGRKGP